MKKNVTAAKGFTIVELLTVMGVIAILIALLVPALGLVTDYAKEVQQSAQFYSIKVGLQIYKTEFGDFPESDDNAYDINQVNNSAYCGANKLAEALVGWDQLGFHPKSEFTPDGLTSDGSNTDNGTPAVYVSNDRNNRDVRKPMFIDLENANVFSMLDIYQGDIAPFDNGQYNYVMSDVFGKKRQTGEKAGMPILYYRARTFFDEQNSDPSTSDTGIGYEDDVFLYADNFNLVNLGDPDTGLAHALADGIEGFSPSGTTAGSGSATDPLDLLDFDNMIVNRQVKTFQRPFNASDYILISAGKDGIYGTIDDMFNFEKKE